MVLANTPRTRGTCVLRAACRCRSRARSRHGQAGPGDPGAAGDGDALVRPAARQQRRQQRVQVERAAQLPAPLPARHLDDAGGDAVALHVPRLLAHLHRELAAVRLPVVPAGAGPRGPGRGPGRPATQPHGVRQVHGQHDGRVLVRARDAAHHRLRHHVPQRGLRGGGGAARRADAAGPHDGGAHHRSVRGQDRAPQAARRHHPLQRRGGGVGGPRGSAPPPPPPRVPRRQPAPVGAAGRGRDGRALPLAAGPPAPPERRQLPAGPAGGPALPLLPLPADLPPRAGPRQPPAAAAARAVRAGEVAGRALRAGGLPAGHARGERADLPEAHILRARRDSARRVLPPGDVAGPRRDVRHQHGLLRRDGEPRRRRRGPGRPRRRRDGVRTSSTTAPTEENTNINGVVSPLLSWLF